MASEIEGCELYVANGELLGSYVALGVIGTGYRGGLTGVQSYTIVSGSAIE